MVRHQPDVNVEIRRAYLASVESLCHGTPTVSLCECQGSTLAQGRGARRFGGPGQCVPLGQSGPKSPDPANSPVRPWVSKRCRDGTLAANSVSFVDDIRPTGGPTEEEARQASQAMAKESARCGIQDAARNCRDVSQTPAAWAGSVVHTTNSSVTIMVEQSKWDKTKTKLKWVSCRLDEGGGCGIQASREGSWFPKLRYAGVPVDDSVLAGVSWNVGFVASQPYRRWF